MTPGSDAPVRGPSPPSPRPADVSVVVPSFRRPERLAECLEALGRLDGPVREVVVVARRGDAGTIELATASPIADVEIVRQPGVLAAMTAGARRATGSVIAFVDDDAAVGPDWSTRITELLRPPDVGAASGRDRVSEVPVADRRTVGTISAWGHMIGDHHLGIGGPRDVDVLKAANVAFRREALALPSGLRGEGAQVHFEVASCTWAATRGWRLVYDGELIVEHRAGARFDSDRRGAPSRRARANEAFNYELALLSQRPRLFARRVAFSLAIGTSTSPGVLRLVVAVLRRERAVAHELIPSLRGRLAGWRAARATDAVAMTTFPDRG